MTTNQKSYTVDEIKQGNVDPAICFKYDKEVLDIEKNFWYPIRSFLQRDGHWDMNSSLTISEADMNLFKDLIYSKYDEVYYMQAGANADKSWFILAKTKGYYIHFEASCSYTGFDCSGGGTFGYSTDWKTLWNKYTTSSLILCIYDYEKLMVEKLFYLDRAYLQALGKT